MVDVLTVDLDDHYPAKGLIEYYDLINSVDLPIVCQVRKGSHPLSGNGQLSREIAKKKSKS